MTRVRQADVMGLAGALPPVGSIVTYDNRYPLPRELGWIRPDGTNVPITRYPRLFEVIGYTHGASMGNGTFTLPNIPNALLRSA